MQLNEGTKYWYDPLTRSILLAWKLKTDILKPERSFKKKKLITSSPKTLSRSTTSNLKMLKSTTSIKVWSKPYLD